MAQEATQSTRPEGERRQTKNPKVIVILDVVVQYNTSMVAWGKSTRAQLSMRIVRSVILNYDYRVHNNSAGIPVHKYIYNIFFNDHVKDTVEMHILISL